MDSVERYFTELRDIRATGAAVRETSYYAPLAELLNEIGRALKPKVRCVMTLKNQGAGLPDGGFFTADQFGKSADSDPLPGQIQTPARGVIEVKSTADDAFVIADGEQVTRYWERYNQVLVANYRDFVLVGRDDEGRPVKLESFRLAESEQDFWMKAAHPRKFAADLGERLCEYLKRAMLHAAPLTDPRDVAAFLASYAREAKGRIERVELPAINALQEALEESLGMKFLGDKGKSFFRSSLVQTLFYGLFSAWVLWNKKHPPSGAARFNWHEAIWTIRVPMIRALFEQFALPTNLQPLGLVEVLDWTADVLNRVSREEFFKKFQERHAVQYFYEPFLAAFDPMLREELGVWYTPEEVVKYQVNRVEKALRDDLGIEDGLADPNVYVLDPCCGTGAYLVEALRSIADTLGKKGGDALASYKLKRAAMERVYGFEILPAPFVVAHLQLNLLMEEAGAPFSETKNERAAVYLTNALTGWAPPKGSKKQLSFLPELGLERDAAEKIKRDAPILVILGNPPYNGFAGVAISEERELSEAYRTTKRAPAPQGQGLNDLYIRFFRMAERRIVEMTMRGIVCFISNYSWLDGLSHTGMREKYMESFNIIRVDCLNGDKYKTGKMTPDGEPDPSVFSTELNREGIQVGTAITTLIHKKEVDGFATVQFRHLWGKTKRDQLRATAENGVEPEYQAITPSVDMGFSLTTASAESFYFSWPLLTALFPTSFPGVKTSRDVFLIDVDRDRLLKRVQDYFDQEISDEEMARRYPEIMESNGRYNARATRKILAARGMLTENIVRYCYRPFDVRWIYWESETKLLDEKRSEMLPHVFMSNMWFEARQRQSKEHFDRGYFTTVLGDNIGSGLSNFFPAYLSSNAKQGKIFKSAPKDLIEPNLSDQAKEYLAIFQMGVEELFYHTLAVLHSPEYRTENCGALRQNWPRIPLTESNEILESSAALGRRVAELLDPESTIILPGNKRVIQSLKKMASMKSTEGARASLNPDAGHLELRFGWGHRGQGGVTMPGKGRVQTRPYTQAELSSMASAAKTQGLTLDDALRLLGSETQDVCLNDVAYWQNIPAIVWTYTIGGYKVIKKWLSYREAKILGRSLSMEEVDYVGSMTRRIAALLLLQPALDANYATIKSALHKWTTSPSVNKKYRSLPSAGGGAGGTLL